MKTVFIGRIFLALALLLLGALSAAAAGTPAALPGDADQDGAISCSEAAQQSAARFDRMDTNKDLVMTITEFEAGTSVNFEAMDADKNSMVDMQEYIITWCGAPPKETKPSQKATRSDNKPLHKSMDSNKNQKVTSDECVAFWTVRFAAIDENKDGSITKDEFGKKVIEWYSITDVNKDGSVTTVEYTDRWVGKCQADQIKKSMSSK
ncbi:MAG: hypothetical protein PHO83_07930 [Geobacteraceae bacterium]|nr:hypothetical protein [Geobacteraceae bacterium]